MNTQTKKLTKKEIRNNALNSHYSALSKVAAICGIPNADGKKLSLKLWKLETEARKLTLMNCNGEGNAHNNTLRLNEIECEVYKLLNYTNFIGFELNTDARGKALKINDEQMRTIYANTGLTVDWVGNGILSPEID